MAGRAGRNLAPKAKSQKRFRPGHEKNREGNTEQRKKLQALPVNIAEAVWREMRGAGIERVKRQGKSLWDGAERPAKSIRTTEEAYRCHVSHQAEDKDIDMQSELPEHDAATHRDGSQRKALSRAANQPAV